MNTAKVKIKKGSSIAELKMAGFLVVEENSIMRVWERGEEVVHETDGYVFAVGKKKKDPWAGICPKGDVAGYIRQQQ